MFFSFFPRAFFALFSFFCSQPWANWSPHFIPFTIQAQAGSNEFILYICWWNSIHKLNKWVKVSLTHRIFIWWWIKVCKKVGKPCHRNHTFIAVCQPRNGSEKHYTFKLPSNFTNVTCARIWISGMTPLCRLDKFCKINASINVSWPQEFKFEIW